MRNSDGGGEDPNKFSFSSPLSLDSRFSQTLRNVQGASLEISSECSNGLLGSRYRFVFVMREDPLECLCADTATKISCFIVKDLNFSRLLKGRSFPGKVLLTRRSDPLEQSVSPSANNDRRFSDSDVDHGEQADRMTEDDLRNITSRNAMSSVNHANSSTTGSENIAKEIEKTPMGARATDSARLMKFTKELSGTNVVLEKLRELAWSGVPPYLRPNVWRLLLGYAPSNSDRREGVLRRKRLEYLDCVAQHYDIPDTERTDEEINMLRQIAVDCPRTVPDVSFFQQVEVQKSLERILYIWNESEELLSSLEFSHTYICESQVVRTVPRRVLSTNNKRHWRHFLGAKARSSCLMMCEEATQ
ncbi:hypothetical protein Sango_0634100 [Sesamum angolense]|uniref:Rab-GAP TBC domain-containing protein n=1 Tax=Sesamum angolense TaxID=2727404 RepID=A0AAE1X708_9LAMI|nr:hypothetical protein Sango_0634100 [Sesamum angolense]